MEGTDARLCRIRPKHERQPQVTIARRGGSAPILPARRQAGHDRRMAKPRWDDARRLRLKGERRDCAVCREPLVYHRPDGEPHPVHVAGKKHQAAVQKAAKVA